MCFLSDSCSFFRSSHSSLPKHTILSSSLSRKTGRQCSNQPQPIEHERIKSLASISQLEWCLNDNGCLAPGRLLSSIGLTILVTQMVRGPTILHFTTPCFQLASLRRRQTILDLFSAYPELLLCHPMHSHQVARSTSLPYMFIGAPSFLRPCALSQ